jgi:hypothetical protein|tara:strand:+ start:334 stop:570 length:237 start_codon:yes stop_codon:yes gene_type:complete
MFKKVMGLIDKLKNREAAQKAASSNNTKRKTSNKDLSLNEEETKVLLHLIKNSNFKGDSVELVYNLTLKLQKVLSILS